MSRSFVIALLVSILGIAVAAVVDVAPADPVSELAGDSDTDAEDDTTSPDEGALPVAWTPRRAAIGRAAWPPVLVPESRSLPVSVPPPTA